MSPKQSPFADLVMPLTKGAVELADISSFKGIQFSTRGERSYTILLDTYGARKSSWSIASFSVQVQWKTVRIPVAAFQTKDPTSLLPPRKTRALHFEIARPAGTDAWLDIDNVSSIDSAERLSELLWQRNLLRPRRLAIPERRLPTPPGEEER